MTLQPEFEPLVSAALAAAQNVFGTRLAAFYLHGSVAMGDAVPLVSDLDAMLILTDSVTADDLAWQTATQAQLAAQYPLVEDVHLNLLSQSDLAQNAFACFALKYNASLLFGQNVAAALPCPAPDAAMARSRLAFARRCFDDALAGKQPACTGPLPKDPFFRARKLARYFVVIEGAYFLMSQNRFVSFRKEDVLPALEKAAPQFSSALRLAQSVLTDPQNAGITADQFLHAILTLVKWMFAYIDRN